MTVQEFKKSYMKVNPDSLWFSRGAMSFHGDTLKNFNVEPTENGWALVRKKHGTFSRVALQVQNDFTIKGDGWKS